MAVCARVCMCAIYGGCEMYGGHAESLLVHGCACVACMGEGCSRMCFHRKVGARSLSYFQKRCMTTSKGLGTVYLKTWNQKFNFPIGKQYY